MTDVSVPRALPDPKPGDVYGFGFVFAPQKFEDIHPGLILAVKVEGRRVLVISVPFSHKEPEKDEWVLDVPVFEARRAGLDVMPQHLFLEHTRIFDMRRDVRFLRGLETKFVGTVSREFMQSARDALLDGVRCGKVTLSRSPSL